MLFSDCKSSLLGIQAFSGVVRISDRGVHGRHGDCGRCRCRCGVQGGHKCSTELHTELCRAQEHDMHVADLKVHLNKVEGEPGWGGGGQAQWQKARVSWGAGREGEKMHAGVAHARSPCKKE